MKIFLPISFVIALATFGAGCDDGGTGTGGSGGTGAGGTGGSTTASGGTGGTGAGGTATTGGSGGTTTTTGTGGSTGSTVNDCDAATAEDHTADTDTTVQSMGLAYSPKCIKIKAGSTVTFVSEFSSHPLVGGEFVNSMKMPDAMSPIQSTNSGSMATFTFPNAGAFGYYCDFHVGSGMKGAVFVE